MEDAMNDLEHQKALVERQRIIDYYRAENADLMAAIAHVTRLAPKDATPFTDGVVEVPVMDLAAARQLARGPEMAAALRQRDRDAGEGVPA
jgi:hypothetical protein